MNVKSHVLSCISVCLKITIQNILRKSVRDIKSCGDFLDTLRQLLPFVLPTAKTKCSHKFVLYYALNSFQNMQCIVFDCELMLPVLVGGAKQTCRYCFYSWADFWLFRPTAEIWQGGADRGSAPPCQISP